jgi:hypothetical protein
MEGSEMSSAWQVVQDDTREGSLVVRRYVERAPVPGGWLVSVLYYQVQLAEREGSRLSDLRGVALQSSGTTFVPDPGHEWQIDDGEPGAE